VAVSSMQARQGEVDETAVHAKLIRRIVPFLFVCYVPAGFLTGRAAAGGIAMIVSIGNLGGFVGPFMIGQIKDLTQSFTVPLIAVACFLLTGSVLMIVFGRLAARDAATEPLLAAA
jgi:nitrate/nitrite transporter NarK